jgi:diketogulonate reductase-like aldo/keto reductase
MGSKTIRLLGGRSVPSLGLGTWHMGERRANRVGEIAALRTGIDLGLTLIDTAEMYASGGAEEMVAEAIDGRRDEVFIISKVLPQNASLRGTIAACDASLKRLRTGQIDLYLLHWRGSYRLSETVEAFERLKADGKIADWGVSNFDVSDMDELAGLPQGGHCAANQVMYHLGARGIEFDLLPHCQQNGIAVMAYCPLGQGRLVGHPAIAKLASKHRIPSSAIALAYLLSKPGVIAIPKSSKPERIKEFASARDVQLDAEDFAVLDRAFPPPKRKTYLAMS